MPFSYLSAISNSIAEYENVKVFDNGYPDLSSADCIYEIFVGRSGWLVTAHNDSMPHSKLAPTWWDMC